MVQILNYELFEVRLGESALVGYGLRRAFGGSACPLLVEVDLLSRLDFWWRILAHHLFELNLKI